jgi:hypothetical protein
VAKACKSCGVEKALDEFRFSDGRHRGGCKACEREWKKQHRKRNPEKVRQEKRRYQRKRARTVDEECVPRLSSGPIREWVLARKGSMQVREVAVLCRLDEVGVSRILSGTYATSSLDTVDKILVAFGSPMELGRLYPELYDDPSVFA